MRILVMADVHSNILALEAVLNAEPNADAVWCLGDAVGYGPNPNECVALLQSLNLTCIAGNHDLGALGEMDLGLFNSDARAACQWTEQALNDESREFLKGLERTAVAEQAFLAHGSPRDPALEYLVNAALARPNFDYFSAPVCLVGHTHVPLVFKRTEGQPGRFEFDTLVPQPNMRVSLGDAKAIVNPGSVGQPRDGNSDAAYMIFEPESVTVTLQRVPYDVAAIQDRIIAAGLPSRLAARLSYGW